MQKLSFIWFSARETKFKSLSSALTKHGIQIQFASLNTLSDREALKSQLEPHSAALIDIKDITSYEELFELTRSLDSEKRFIPFIWVYDELDSEQLLKIINIGINDFFSVKTPVAEALYRLKLRIQESRLLYEFQLEINKQGREDAAKETAIKQREEFLSVCAHDLRSPLGLVYSSLSLILNSEKDHPVTAFVREVLMRARRQSSHAITLVNDLLDVMSYEQGLKPEYELFSLGSFLEEFYKDYSFQSQEKGVKFHYDNSLEGWRILADKDRVHQLLQNLFTNALKFTESGKNIYLSTHSFQGRRKTDPPYPMVMISVKDEGKGIPKEKLQKIFDRFTQVKDYGRAEGRGLGLTVVKQISNLHEGNVWVESKPGQGATFNVLFPHAVNRLKKGKSSSETKKILVAEPKDSRRQEFFKALEDWGYEVKYTSDGVSTLGMAYHWYPDLIILTNSLGRMGETDVANTLKSDPLMSEIPIFLAVDRMGENGALRGDNILVDQVVSLPFSKVSFQKCLSSLITRSIEGNKDAA